MKNGGYSVEFGRCNIYCQRRGKKGEPVRIFACGGDGTTFRALNGLIGYPNVTFGVIPCGTGNDFIKAIGDALVFFDIENQINGKIVKIDSIKANEYYSLNQASMGMDAAVCGHKDSFSKIPMVKGKTAYTLSLLYCFLYKIKNKFTICIDDLSEESGSYVIFENESETVKNE